MADNLNFTFKRGEVGKVLDFTLKANGALVNLTTPTDWTVTLAIAASKSATPVATAQAVTKADQTTNTGQCSHTLNATTANIAVGLYKACELKLTNGSNVLYWPVDANDNHTYFTIECQQPIS